MSLSDSAALYSVLLEPMLTNRPISQIPQCIRQISKNAPFCNRNVHVHISVTKCCIVGYGTDAL